MTHKKILGIIAGRYYPEYNGQAKIFHESASRIVKKNLASIDVLRFRYDGNYINEYNQDKITVQPKGIYLLFGLFTTALSFYFYFLKNHKRYEVVHAITVTWTTIICLNIARIFKKKTIMESSALGDVLSPRGQTPKLIYWIKEYFKQKSQSELDIIRKKTTIMGYSAKVRSFDNN